MKTLIAVELEREMSRGKIRGITSNVVEPKDKSLTGVVSCGIEALPAAGLEPMTGRVERAEEDGEQTAGSPD